MALPHITPDVFPRLFPITLVERGKFDHTVLDLKRTVNVDLRVEPQVFALIEQSKFFAESSEQEKRDFAEAVLGLHFLYSMAAWSRSAFLNDLKSSLIVYLDSEFESRLPDETTDEATFDQNELVKEFIDRANAILDIDSVRTSVKAFSLMSEHERIYLSARIFTDVRPVFAEELDNSLPASVITHTIKLISRVDGQQKAMFFVADSDDLETLKAEIDRALNKRSIILRKISTSNALGQPLDVSEE